MVVDRFFRKNSGVILLFLSVLIATLGSGLATLFNSTRLKKQFYLQATKYYGFFDKKQNLRGLVELEIESMAHLTIAALKKHAANEFPQHTFQNKPMATFVTRPSSVKNKNNILNKYCEIDKVYGLIKNLGIKKEDIKHNFELTVDIKILPLDYKIPISVKFEKEIGFLVNEILTSNNIKISQNVGKNLSDSIIALLQNAAKNKGHDVIGATKTDIETYFRQLQAWQDFFKDQKRKSQESKILNEFADSITFFKQVESVNFFLANRYVQVALVKGHGINKTWDINNVPEAISILDDMYDNEKIFLYPSNSTTNASQRPIPQKLDDFFSWSKIVEIELSSKDREYSSSVFRTDKFYLKL